MYVTVRAAREDAWFVRRGGAADNFAEMGLERLKFAAREQIVHEQSIVPWKVDTRARSTIPTRRHCQLFVTVRRVEGASIVHKSVGAGMRVP